MSMSAMLFSILFFLSVRPFVLRPAAVFDFFDAFFFAFFVFAPEVARRTRLRPVISRAKAGRMMPFSSRSFGCVLQGGIPPIFNAIVSRPGSSFEIFALRAKLLHKVDNLGIFLS